ncbi:hypothetical protein QJ857_gp0829 [Tupanvirus soda lake]|uniref:Uncharacterized protein n=2 Tax=Tupanvirus TaxID=2094720 RepID=A0A6N1NMJ8_9VIRU|nr:hypothetical protein QJ857_gp0829 [Tupanvirus soda lake]QKU35220.1 hypothetical protein [Tupanvirus soda lake]
MEVVNKMVGSFLNVISFRTLVKVVGNVALATLVWEHIGRKRETDFRPSVGLTLASDKSKNFFNWVGRGLALTSSYLTQLDLKDIAITVRDVGKPSVDLVVSPFHTLYGYVNKAQSYHKKEWMVYFGSGLAVLFMCAGYYRFGNYLPTFLLRMPRLLGYKS